MLLYSKISVPSDISLKNGLNLARNKHIILNVKHNHMRGTQVELLLSTNGYPIRETAFNVIISKKLVSVHIIKLKLQIFSFQ